MMGEDSSSDGLPKARSALADVTNQLGKRGFSSISANSGVTKYGNGKRNLTLTGKDKGKSACVSARPCTEIKFLKGNVISGISKILDESKESQILDLNDGISKGDNTVCGVSKVPLDESRVSGLNDSNKGNTASDSSAVVLKVAVHGTKDSELADPSEANATSGSGVGDVPDLALCKTKDSNFLDFGKGNEVMQCSDGGQEQVNDGCIRRTLAPTNAPERNSIDLDEIFDIEEDEVNSEDTKSETHRSEIGKYDDGDQVGENLALSQTGSVDFGRFPESQESRNFGLERCVGQKNGEACTNSSTGPDLINACSCSFCMKAAHMWADLHYQDIKGRIAVLQRSQKEANILVERSCKVKGIEKYGPESSSKVSKLETDLMAQWKTLFLHMENIFECETNQLESRLSSLKDLKDKFKTELEFITGIPSDNQ